MKKYLNCPVVNLNNQKYLALIIFLSPLLNFLGGINIDIYSPSMPSIAEHFSASALETKNTISITLLGWTIGALFFGALIDSIGRKRTLLFGLLFYVLASVFATFSQSIFQLMVLRFIQGFVISTITVGCRALIIDTVSGSRYAVAILYTSLGYGLGPIIGPFIGSILQHYFGWEANFIALAVLSGILLILFFIFVKESIPEKQTLRLKPVLSKYLCVLSNKVFVAGAIISGVTQAQLMLYPTLGPFIVENVLNYDALTYGRTALVIGASYLIGNLVGRLLLKYFLPKQVCHIGLGVLASTVIFSYLFSIFFKLGLVTIAIPLIFLCISGGLVFPTVLGNNLKQFPGNAGIAMAVQASLVLFCSSVGVFIISHIHVVNLFQLSTIFLTTALIEIIVFFCAYRKAFDKV